MNYYREKLTRSSEKEEFNWLYVARNSVPKYTVTNDVKKDDKYRVTRSNREIMGIENLDGKKAFDIMKYYFIIVVLSLIYYLFIHVSVYILFAQSDYEICSFIWVIIKKEA